MLVIKPEVRTKENLMPHPTLPRAEDLMPHPLMLVSEDKHPAVSRDVELEEPEEKQPEDSRIAALEEQLRVAKEAVKEKSKAAMPKDARHIAILNSLKSASQEYRATKAETARKEAKKEEEEKAKAEQKKREIEKRTEQEKAKEQSSRNKKDDLFEDMMKRKAAMATPDNDDNTPSRPQTAGEAAHSRMVMRASLKGINYSARHQRIKAQILAKEKAEAKARGKAKAQVLKEERQEQERKERMANILKDSLAGKTDDTDEDEEDEEDESFSADDDDEVAAAEKADELHAAAEQAVQSGDVEEIVEETSQPMSTAAQSFLASMGMAKAPPAEKETPIIKKEAPLAPEPESRSIVQEAMKALISGAKQHKKPHEIKELQAAQAGNQDAAAEDAVGLDEKADEHAPEKEAVLKTVAGKKVEDKVVAAVREEADQKIAALKKKLAAMESKLQETTTPVEGRVETPVEGRVETPVEATAAEPMAEAKKVTSTSEDTDAAPADNHHFLTDAQNKAIEDLNKQSESSEAVETTPEQDDTVTPVAKEDTAEPQPVAEPKVTQMTEDKHGETSSPAEAVETTPEQDDTVTPVAKEDTAEPQPVAEPKVEPIEDAAVEPVASMAVEPVASEAAPAESLASDDTTAASDVARKTEEMVSGAVEAPSTPEVDGTSGAKAHDKDYDDGIALIATMRQEGMLDEAAKLEAAMGISSN